MDDDLYFMRLTGGDVGNYFDLVVADAGAATMRNTLTDFGADDFIETQDASAGAWAGAQIRTQSHAQEALAALDAAINRKDKIRADLGAFQNRLENNSTSLQIQGENLQASESRISDIDVALEMTEYTRQSIIAQAAAAMLSQANTLPQLALTLLG
jgi:flagellin